MEHLFIEIFRTEGKIEKERKNLATDSDRFLGEMFSVCVYIQQVSGLILAPHEAGDWPDYDEQVQKRLKLRINISLKRFFLPRS